MRADEDPHAVTEARSTRRALVQRATALGIGASFLAGTWLRDRSVDAGSATPVPGGSAEATPTTLAGDPLPSWNETANRQAILDFVDAATDEHGPNFVPPALRIATFDLDGTLMIEHPLYIQITFAYDRVQPLISSHPEWRSEEPFATLLSGDRETMATLSSLDITRILATAFPGMTVAEFQASVADWLATARHSRFDRPYTELFYQPMAEVLKLLRDHDFKVYIVSGTDQDFIRVFSESLFGVAPEQVIGTANGTSYEVQDGTPVIVRQDDVLFIDDRKGKPEAINLIIGQRPCAAFGNSNGDREMLEWTAGGNLARLMMLIHHDDGMREYEYDENTRVGNLSAALMTEANERGWHVVSMKNDWRRIFPS
jgi:phosphoglycolate phosphatase-like HAD superfamily hydrolase